MSQYKKAKWIGKDAALQKLRHYCAYQERCHQEVRSKLLTIGLRGEELEEVMAQLISEDFLNEERFAKAYIGGKFRIKKWGKIKTIQALKQKHISDYSIKKGLLEISEEDYLHTVQALIAKKRDELKSKIFDTYEINSKIAQYLISRGYEPDLVWKELKLE